MHRLAIFTLLLLGVALPLHAQSPTPLPIRANAYDADSLKTGEWIYYYNVHWAPAAPADSIAYYRLVTYNQGQPTGPFGDYFANGRPQMLGDSLITDQAEHYYGRVIYYATGGTIANYEYYDDRGLNMDLSLSKMLAVYDSLQQGQDPWDAFDKAQFLDFLGYLYYKLGRYCAAEAQYKQALPLLECTVGPHHITYIYAIQSLAMVYYDMGRYTQAEALLLQALDIQNSITGVNKAGQLEILNKLAILYELTDRYEEAETLYLQILAIDQENQSPEYASKTYLMNNLASLYTYMGRYAEAERLLLYVLEEEKRTLGTKNAEYAINLDNLGFAYKAMGRYAEAEALFLQVLDIRKAVLGTQHPTYSYTLLHLAQLYWHTHREVEALPLWEELLDYHQHRLATYFEQLGEDERRDYYATVAKMFEQFTGVAIAARQRYPHLLERALNIQLQHKALLLNTSTQIKHRILASGDRKLIALYDEVQTLKQALGQQYTQSQGVDPLDSLRQALQAKDQALTEYSVEYKTAHTPVTWPTLQAQLGKREALVEMLRYRVTDYQLGALTDSIRYAAVILTAKAKQPLVVELPNGNHLEQEALAYYKNGITYQLDDRQSYTDFWEPLTTALKRIDKVYFSPDGVYHQLNLETLRNPKTGQYLYEEWDVEVITTGRDLLAVVRDPLPNRRVLLLGNPDFGSPSHEDINISPAPERSAVGPSLPSSIIQADMQRGDELVPLPGTEQEVKALAALFQAQGWQLDTHLGAAATEEALKDMLKPKVLHIATHGFFQEEIEGDITYATDPLYRSGLLLSGAANTLYNKEDLHGNVQQGKEDGILTAFEAKNLNIDNTELVVLSACETGLGEIRNGEGVYGLQRALKVAGARSIIMSLWKVNDQTTQQLMVSFYKYWLGGMTKRAAFRKAQQELMAQYPHPYYWGAFVLIGE